LWGDKDEDEKIEEEAEEHGTGATGKDGSSSERELRMPNGTESY